MQVGQEAVGGQHLELRGRRAKVVHEAGEGDADVLEHPLVVMVEQAGEQRHGVGHEVGALDGQAAAQVGGRADRDTLDARREEVDELQHRLHAAPAQDGQRVLV